MFATCLQFPVPIRELASSADQNPYLDNYSTVLPETMGSLGRPVIEIILLIMQCRAYHNQIWNHDL